MSAPAAWTGAEASPPLSGRALAPELSASPSLSGRALAPEPPVASAPTGLATPGGAAAEACTLCSETTLGELPVVARFSPPPAPASMVGSVAMDTGPPVVVTLASGVALRSR